MGKKGRRLFAVLFALIFTGLSWTNAGVETKAANQTSITRMWFASVQDVGEVPQLQAGYVHGKIIYTMIGGESAYCMNYGLRSNQGLTVTGSTNRSTALSEQQSKLLAYCMHYGFAADSEGAPNAEEACHYIATQSMIWMINSGIYGTSSAEAAAGLLCLSAPNAARARELYDSLKAKIDQAMNAQLPSFATDQAGRTMLHELEWNERSNCYEAVLTDSTAGLSAYTISLDQVEVRQGTNQVTLSTKTPISTALQASLLANTENTITADSCLYWLTGRSGYQEFVTGKPTAEKKTGSFAVRTGPYGTVRIRKTDAESMDGTARGDGTLAGAVYGLYAGEEITAAGTKLYDRDVLVATLTTDEKGEASVTGLTLGQYYLKEITAPEGYCLTENKVPVSLQSARDGSKEIIAEVDLKDQVKKQAFRLIKVRRNGTAAEMQPVAGVGFQAYLLSDLTEIGDGTYDYANAEPVVVGEDNATTLWTDENGQAESLPLPYGTYLVVESETPKDLLPIDPFLVTVTEDKPDEPQQWRILLDEDFLVRLRITKKDAVTGEVIPQAGTEFRIQNLDTGEYISLETESGDSADAENYDISSDADAKKRNTSFFTDESGSVTLPMKLGAGRYRIEELRAPEGYLLNTEGYEAELRSDMMYQLDQESGEIVVEVCIEDEPEPPEEPEEPEEPDEPEEPEMPEEPPVEEVVIVNCKDQAQTEVYVCLCLGSLVMLALFLIRRAVK